MDLKYLQLVNMKNFLTHIKKQILSFFMAASIINRILSDLRLRTIFSPQQIIKILVLMYCDNEES